MATHSVNINVSRSSAPTSHYHQSLLKDWPRRDAPLAVCVSFVTMRMCVRVSPEPLVVVVVVLQHLLSLTASLTPAWHLATLLALFAPQQQQQARWHSRWQWPQERRVHPQQQSTLAPYRHRPLDEAICRGHLWVDDIISSQPIKTSKWKAGVFSMLFGGRLPNSHDSFNFNAVERKELVSSVYMKCFFFAWIKVISFFFFTLNPVTHAVVEYARKKKQMKVRLSSESSNTAAIFVCWMSGNSEKCSQGDSFQFHFFIQLTVQNAKIFSLLSSKTKNRAFAWYND